MLSPEGEPLVWNLMVWNLMPKYRDSTRNRDEFTAFASPPRVRAQITGNFFCHANSKLRNSSILTICAIGQDHL